MTIRRYDLVFLYREAIPIGPPIIERIIRGLGVPIVHDFDDAIFMPGERRQSGAGVPQEPGRVATVLKLSRHATLGNEFLAQYARRHTTR